MKPNTQEWLEFRKQHVGASDAPIIMKQSPFKTPYELWQEKLSLVPTPETNAAMQRGHDLEPIAKQELERKLDMPLQSKIKLSIERSWMMASLDAISFDERTIAEIKCPGKADHDTALSGRVPEKYYAQLQHQMVVCELDAAYYFSFTGDENVLLEVHRDEKYIRNLLIEEEKFWLCVQNFEVPELLDRDYVYHGDAHWAKLAERLKAIRELQAEEEAIKKELIALAQGKNAMGAGIKLAKCTRKGAVDYAKIPELKTVDLEAYRKKSSEYWKVCA